MAFTTNLQSLFGLLALTGLAVLLGERRKAPAGGARLKIAAVGLLVQLAIAVIALKLPPLRLVFAWLNDAVGALQAASEAGTSFVFGYLGGGPLPFEETQPGASFVFAFRALPLILVMSALSSLLFYWRVLPLVVRGFARALQRGFGISGAAGIGVAANVFVGMVEAPLLVRPYLAQLSRGELFMVMTAGMATIAGTVMALYATILVPVIPDAIGHLLTASIISAPAAVMVARLMIVEADGNAGATSPDLRDPDDAHSAMDAITRGTLSGVTLLINIVAMLVVLVALVHLVNLALGALLPELAGAPVTLQRLLGYAMAPVAWLMGVPWAESATAGGLLGVKIVLNEFLAFLDLVALPESALAPRSRLIMTYALTGFANFGSLGIMIGGMATIAPSRRGEIVALGMRAIVAGTIATCMTGAIVGLLIF